MQKILKMTDISPAQVKDELGYIRYVSLLAPEVKETEEGVILTCNVTDQNRLVYAEVLSSLSEYVYTDTNQSAFERICDIAEVRGLKFAFVEQGSRGKLTTTLLDTASAFDSSLVSSIVLKDKDALKTHFKIDNVDEILDKFKDTVDVAVLTMAQFEENPLVPSVCHVYVAVGEAVSNVRYQIMGTKSQVAERLTFLAACFVAKKIF